MKYIILTLIVLCSCNNIKDSNSCISSKELKSIIEDFINKTSHMSVSNETNYLIISSLNNRDKNNVFSLRYALKEDLNLQHDSISINCSDTIMEKKVIYYPYIRDLQINNKKQFELDIKNKYFHIDNSSIKKLFTHKQKEKKLDIIREREYIHYSDVCLGIYCDNNKTGIDTLYYNLNNY